MSVEAQLFTVLSAVCPRVFPDFAPMDTVRPYVTFQNIGGTSIRFLNKATGDKRTSRIQINAWAETRAASLTLIRAIEDALCASSVFIATPDAEPISAFDHDFPVYGSIQDFTIHATR